MQYVSCEKKLIQHKDKQFWLIIGNKSIYKLLILIYLMIF